MKKEAAFSGLEAAIVLIAFVVVAAVFSYVMLGAGFFATSKSQEVTYSGIKQTTSNVVLDGYLYGGWSNNKLDTLQFYIKVPEGGETVQTNQINFLYAKGTDAPAEAECDTGCDVSLAPGNRTEIILEKLEGPAAGASFTLEIKPRVGASTLIQRTLSSGYCGGVIY